MTPALWTIVIGVGVIAVLLGIATGMIWIERRLLARFQDRLGPNRVGPQGLLQPIADVIKLFTKEDWIPPFGDKLIFVVAPAVVVVPVLLAFAVVPVTQFIKVSDANVGLLFFLGMTSLGIYSVVLAGWSSNSKYSLIGGMRAAAQLISYEIPMALTLAAVVLLAGSLRLTDIVNAQSAIWYVAFQPLGFVIFVIAGFAEARRTPFDIPEAESELVAGYHTEYSEHEVRAVLHGRVPRRRAHERDDDGALSRRLDGSGAAGSCVVLHQDGGHDLPVCLGPRGHAEVQVRSTDVASMEVAAAAFSGQLAADRRGCAGCERITPCCLQSEPCGRYSCTCSGSR